jgi:hypothetical protein
MVGDCTSHYRAVRSTTSDPCRPPLSAMGDRSFGVFGFWCIRWERILLSTRTRSCLEQLGFGDTILFVCDRQFFGNPAYSCVRARMPFMLQLKKYERILPVSKTSVYVQINDGCGQRSNQRRLWATNAHHWTWNRCRVIPRSCCTALND